MYYILDCETTGASSNDEIIELAWLKVDNNVKTLEVLEEFNQRYKPNVSINPNAIAVHGIYSFQLANCPNTRTLCLPKDMKVMFAHNAAFDARMLGTNLHPDTLVVCTIKLIKELEKLQGAKFGFANYKLATIFKHWYPEMRAFSAANHHSALGDCEMLCLILLKVFQCFQHFKSIEELLKITKFIKEE